MKVLLVDDDQDMCQMLKNFVLNQHDCVVNYNSKEAVYDVDHNEFDIIITDYSFNSGYTGEDLIHHIKETPNKNATVVLITGYSTRDLKSDADYVLQKPFSLRDLSKILDVITENFLEEDLKKIVDKADSFELHYF